MLTEFGAKEKRFGRKFPVPSLIDDEAFLAQASKSDEPANFFFSTRISGDISSHHASFLCFSRELAALNLFS